MEDIVNGAAETADLFEGGVGLAGFYATVIIYFLLLALIIGGFIFFRKYMRTGKLGGAVSGSNMKIKDRLVIAQDKQIILVEIKDKILMIGVSSHGMATLAEFEKSEFKLAEGLGGAQQNNGGFLGALSEKFKTGFDNFGNKKQ